MFYRGVAFAMATTMAAAAFAAEAQATEFRFGELAGSFDTTISAGATMRASKRDCRLVGTSNGGCNASATNRDDGNLNFDRGDIVSAPASVSHDLSLEWRNFGAFMRAHYFYDAVLNDADSTRRTDLSDAARDQAGRGAELLDAYVYGTFNIAGMPTDIRFGNQAVNWGESLFTPGGINATNPVDVSKLHQAGSELKLATLPTPMARIATMLPFDVSVEAYYQLAWEKTKLDPVGSFFSQGDLTGEGTQGFFFGSDPGAIGNAAYLNYMPKQAGRTPKDGGQWGAALRYFADDWSSEFGLYYLRYHAKTPILGVNAQRIPVAPFTRPTGYFEEYSEDIDLYGASFNTQLFGSSIGGEISYQPDFPAPLNFSSTVALARARAALGPMGGFYAQSGVVMVEKWQAALVSISSFGPSDGIVGSAITGLGATSGSLSTELVGNKYDGLDPSVPYAVPDSKTVPTDTAWGYRLAAGLSYPEAFGTGVSLTPSIAFRHDVYGTQPNNPNGATIIEGRKIVTVGLSGAYLGHWRAGISYTNNFGAGGDDLLNDRDFVDLSISYSF
ncbi:DUF1302 domain-containing protein [Parvibaculum sp.]|uniref:DUF1302 domain-containing protein n=1 Tax=Parvibaculum sp. TaxID=2024848 RepID=UPI0027310762|nr:DUF1302 domain-containing protein [Parvibaculum sp.]MDP1626577.1 DUF1302 domain-containing protein [Parvibaculum sp.]MDP2150499.1 DUF1302 domain-containing protein [Parvibaculum sp.]MDP3327015.1 DUF1302 domain-containing protein [Parvibaculum sp.]